MEKIRDMEKTLQPIWLPIEVAYSDQFKCGSHQNRQELRRRVLMKFEEQNPIWFH